MSCGTVLLLLPSHHAVLTDLSTGSTARCHNMEHVDQATNLIQCDGLVISSEVVVICQEQHAMALLQQADPSQA